MDILKYLTYRFFWHFADFDQINVMTVEPVYGIGQKLQLGSTDCVTQVGA
jgi:hypothetical protein